MDPLSSIAALLRSDFAEEAGAGFPRLTRIPCTAIIKFLDYFDSLVPAERESLLDVLARFGAMRFLPVQRINREYQELRVNNPAYVRFWAAIESQAFTYGYRYWDVKMTKMTLSDPETLAAIAKNRSTLAWRPRDDPRQDLLPDPDLGHLQPAKAALLRQLVGKAFAGLFCTEKRKLAGGETGYTGSIGATKLTAWVDFGSRAAQLRYGVSIASADRTISVSRLSYEDLWLTNLGWDYLTEENASRSVELLCEQVVYLVSLLDRVTALSSA